MAEEEVIEELEITDEVRKTVIGDYLKSQTHIDFMNAEKGKWGETYKKDKLPTILEAYGKEVRESTIKELNPEETETDKRLRALEESNAEKDKIIETNNLKQKLSSKAKEIGFDISRAGRYSIYGEEAENRMLEDHKWITDKVTAMYEKKVKGSVDGDDPIVSEEPTDDTFDFKARMKESTDKIKK